MFFTNWLKENPILLNTLILVALVAGSWLLGAWVAGAIRAKEYGWKFGCIFFALFASIVIIYRGWPPKLGIDLGGGSILVYQVDHTKTEWRPDKMDSLVAAIANRVNPGGQKEISVRALGTDMVQIIMPAPSGATAAEKQAQSEEVKEIIRRTGAMEFSIVANRRDNQSLIERAAAARLEACRQNPNTDKARIVWSEPNPITGRRKEIAKWVSVRDNPKEQSVMRNDDAAIEVDDGKNEDGSEKKRLEVLVLAPENESTTVTGKDIRNAQAGQGPEGWQVSFTLSSDGGAKFGTLTGEHVPIDNFKYKLAIVLDNVLQSAPNLNSAIQDRGEITGDFSEKEAKDLADIINRGSLPAALNPDPVRDMTTDATLGADTIRQSLTAMIVAAFAVPLFMIFYYRFAGVIAVTVLSLTVLMLVAIMVLVKAPFTLTALAGLALAVGMEVDNNVLIYERLREELRHGAALRMALRNSFHRVGVVIVDANITHILAAAVLFYVGTEQVKGFAITFLLGALLSIWATMFVAKTLFEVAERRFRVQRMHMMEWIGHTTIDFMHWFKACATFSVAITVLGLVVAGIRGKGLFDIDFTGGISVQTVFREPAKIEDIRKEVNQHEKELPDATVTPVKVEGEPAEHRFVFDTSNMDGTYVQKLLQEVFGSQLVTAQMKYEIGPASAIKLSPSEVMPETPKSKTPGAPATTGTLPKVIPPKPAEPPRDMSVPEVKLPEPKSTATKPAELKGPELKAPEPKSPEPKSTGTKPAEPAPTPKQSSMEIQAGGVTIVIEPEVVVFTAFDASGGTVDTSAPPKPEAAHEVQSDAKSAATSPKSTASPPKAAAPSAVITETAPPAKPQAKTTATPPAKPEPKSETKAVPSKPAPAARPKSELSIAPSISTEPIQATVSFTVSLPKQEGDKVVDETKEARVTKVRLNDLVNQALDANQIPHDAVNVDLTNDTAAESADTWTVTFTPLTALKINLTTEKVKAVLNDVKAEVSKQPYFPGVDNMGSAVALDTRFWACVALVLSWSLIILYLWIRFQGVAFGLAAVIALIHDVLVMLGAIAFSSYLALIPGVTALTLIEPFKINLTIVAAFLTIIGYSVNDTIVVFDRIREIRGKSPILTRQMVNDATNQTLSRTVLTSFTVLLVILILYIFGGQAVHGFAFALFIGVLTGTYSSIYVAAPILLWLLHPTQMRGGAGGSTASSR